MTTELQTESAKPEEAGAPVNPQAASRRQFLFKLSIALNGIVGAVFAVPIIGYLLGPAMKKPSATEFWVGLGPVNQFPEGETRLVSFRNPSTSPWDGQTADIPAWVRRISGNSFQVFAINCAHLGCPVRWFAQSKLFMCPCHGGAYYENGQRASGPPERGLFEYEYKIESNNLIISVGDLPTIARPGTKQVAECPGAAKSAAAAPLVQIGEAGKIEPKQDGGAAWPA
jgi:Rieske Fe-S protein